MLTTLLSPETAPLTSLYLLRLQLDQTEPSVALHVDSCELCLYPLLGQVRAAYGGHTCLLGQRRSVRQLPIQVLRVPAGMPLDLTLFSQAADLLVAHIPNDGNPPPVWHQDDVRVHDVGEGCYRRTVCEVPTPPGYRLHCGQTMNIPGGWSSWPSHATPEETMRYAEHEEVFWVTTPGYALMRLDGVSVTGQRAQGLLEIGNDTALVTPLGSHEIVFSPGAWGLYVWFYHSFLKKTYNTWAHEYVKTYQK